MRWRHSSEFTEVETDAASPLGPSVRSMRRLPVVALTGVTRCPDALPRTVGVPPLVDRQHVSRSSA